MSNITDAINACHGLIPAFQAGDCKTVEVILNSQVKSPDKRAVSYVKGYWMASVRYMPEHVLKDGPMLRHNHINGWRCFKANDAN